MPEILNLDVFDNGGAGALERLTAGFAARGLPFEVISHRAEQHRARLAGTASAA